MKTVECFWNCNAGGGREQAIFTLCIHLVDFVEGTLKLLISLGLRWVTRFVIIRYAGANIHDSDLNVLLWLKFSYCVLVHDCVWRRVVLLLNINVSKEPLVSMHPEEGRTKSLRNIINQITKLMTSHPGRHCHGNSHKNPKTHHYLD
jgi:hypothetical protein